MDEKQKPVVIEADGQVVGREGPEDGDHRVQRGRARAGHRGLTLQAAPAGLAPPGSGHLGSGTAGCCILPKPLERSDGKD